jgi:aryl-alcohol dehydrogenase-like predicted oxidoreductase
MNTATLLKRSKHFLMSKAISKLALGSVNFGLDYGLVNNFGKISDTELEQILSFASRSGIKVIDTAQAYGDSELRIGALSSAYSFLIVTKIGADLESDCLKGSISGLMDQSLKRLNQSRLYAVMLHRPEILLGNKGSTIIKDLRLLKDQNLICKVGISVYSPEILEEVLKLFQFDIVQAPFNIFDQQMLLSGWSYKLKERGIEVHTRSAFLQGLLLMQKQDLHTYFRRNWPNLFNDWYKFLRDNNVGALDVALKFALKQDWIDKVVVGVDSVSQLRSLVGIEKASVSLNFPKLGCDDPKLINPSKWNLV